MITDNTKKPQTDKQDLSYEMWKEKFGSQYANLSEEQLQQKWKEQLSQESSTSTTTDPQFTDNTGSQTTELQQNKPANNIDLMGTTNTLTQFGISTGNTALTKAGILGNSTIKAIQQIKAIKGSKNLKGTDKVAGIAGEWADTADQVFFGNQAAKNSNLTNTINSGYDMTSSVISSLGPTGAMIGGAMKVGGLLSDGLTTLGVGTDQMTATDKILDSKLLKLTPVGLINSIGASTSDKFSVDNSIREQIGGSYGGAYTFMDNAASRAGKKYGLFSGGAKNRANRDIATSKVMQGQISNINKDARDKESIVSANNQLLSTNYQFNLAGGYDQRYIRAAKEGSKIERIKKINLTFRKGGQIHQTINLETKEVEWQPVIIHRAEELKHGGTISWTYDDQEPQIKDDWEPVIIYKDGGKTENVKEKPLSNQQNVIPEGALHAHKHHMENTEGLTQKGIPVIDNKGEQQAEIELNEIIFNLEVTKKLEELCEDGSDEAAIEAGKLLVQEILFNTNDRTGIIKTLKQGGTINGDTE